VLHEILYVFGFTLFIYTLATMGMTNAIDDDTDIIASWRLAGPGERAYFSLKVKPGEAT
jgi:hypothetical protein